MLVEVQHVEGTSMIIEVQQHQPYYYPWKAHECVSWVEDFHPDEVTVYDTAGWDFKDWSSISCKTVWICGYCMLSSPIYNGRFGLVSKTWNESIS